MGVEDIDVVEARAGESRLILKTKPEANGYQNLVTAPGTYRFSVYLTAENIDPLNADLCVTMPTDGGKPIVVSCGGSP